MHLTLLILLTATSLYSQISGSVVDAETNQPIAGVNITSEQLLIMKAGFQLQSRKEMN